MTVTIDKKREVEANAPLSEVFQGLLVALLMLGILVVVLNEFFTVIETDTGPLNGSVDKVIDGTSQVVDFGIILIIVAIAGQMIRMVSQRYR